VCLESLPNQALAASCLNSTVAMNGARWNADAAELNTLLGIGKP
jgi:hypothetical protein